MFAPKLRERAQALVDRYPVGRSALLPLLHLVQAQDGYISDDGIAECARLLSLTKAEVNSVATFYTMYKREPMGRHLVSVCTNFSCKVRGGQEVYDRLSERLGVGHNGTDANTGITLEHAECLGNCEGAPVVTVDYLNYEAVTPDAAVELVERVAAGEVPPPTRGFPSPGIRDMEYRLAGLGPRHPRDGELSLVSTSDAALPPPTGRGDATVRVGTPEREAERRDATEQVEETGLSADEVEDESAYSAREAPTNDPGSEEETSYPAADPRKDDLEPRGEGGAPGAAQPDPPAPPGGGESHDPRDTSRLLTADGIADEPQSAPQGATRPPEQGPQEATDHG
jgi:NADH-quinone oxidoreductase subunit E